MAITIRSREGATEIEPGPGENLLYAGLRAGLPLPYECATGTCGTCKGRVRSGTVEDAWPEAPGRGSLKPELGDILLCQSLPPGEYIADRGQDCEILVPGKLVFKPWHRFIPVHGTAILSHVQTLTEDVLSFRLHLDRPLPYLAGQFLALRFPGIQGYRAYSMTNYSPQCQELHFVLKEVAGGNVSSLLFEIASTTGQASRSIQTIEYFGPLGGAVFLPEEGANILAIAGGSGIAGMMSMLEQAQAGDYFEDRQGHVFFGVRTLHDLFFAERLNRWQQQSKNLRVVVALSEESPPAEGEHRGLKLAGGFVHEVAAAHLREHLTDHIAYVAGPPPMVDRAIRMLLTQGQLSPERIRYDKFS